jgi:hypothetical protein
MIGPGIVPIPGVHEPLEMIRYGEGKPSLGDILPDHVLVEMGNKGLRRRD